MTNDFQHAGTVSHGTLRNQDLLETFLGKLRDFIGEGAAPNIHDGRDHANLASEAQVFLDEHRTEGPMGGDLEYDATVAERANELVIELQDALNEYAPEGWYFGAIEGDGSDFGFWRDPEATDEREFDVTVRVHLTADDTEHAEQRANAMAASLEEFDGVRSASATISEEER